MIAQAIIDYDLVKYDLQFRMWASEDPLIATELKKVYNKRYDYLKKAFSELDFEGEELEMRVRFFVCYYTWGPNMLWKDSRSKSKMDIESRINLLVKK